MLKSKVKGKLEYTSLVEEAQAIASRTRNRCSVCIHPRRVEIEACFKEGLYPTAIAQALNDPRISIDMLQKHSAKRHGER